ncbi:hypothetical protein HYW55_04065 [Candidatus Gottesmanbacteria bacterium]|nr:hypothetical protein [Candidatus Gottesmanbacteria bacterium]
MKRLNWIFTLSSLNVLLVTVERFSFTGKILLQPYNFLRLHEIVQMTTLILFTVLLPFFILREITGNFAVIGEKKGFFLFLFFLIGVYFYATGNGVHEIASFLFNNYCDVREVKGELCGNFFFNDYYTGNIFYFFGGALMVIPILLLEKYKQYIKFTKKDMTIALINACFYSLAIFAYAAFDRVLVGLIYTLFIALFSFYMFFQIRRNFLKYPVITYTTLAYCLGGFAALVVRVL